MRCLVILAAAVLTVGGAVLFASRAIGSAVVTSASMAPTLVVGDHLLFVRAAYTPARTPARGDVVIFRVEEGRGPVLYVKRVVGVPGDVVAVEDRRLSVNGRAAGQAAPAAPLVLDDEGAPAPGAAADLFHGFRSFVESLDGRRYRAIAAAARSPGEHSHGRWVVAPGSVFVLGDNRDDSRDSRAAPEDGGLGPVPLANIVGRVSYVWASYGSRGLRASRFALDVAGER